MDHWHHNLVEQNSPTPTSSLFHCRNHGVKEQPVRRFFFIYELQLNPAIAHLKGLVRIMLYTEVFTIANIGMSMILLFWTKICLLFWQGFVISGCAIAGFHYVTGVHKKSVLRQFSALSRLSTTDIFL